MNKLIALFTNEDKSEGKITEENEDSKERNNGPSNTTKRNYKKKEKSKTEKKDVNQKIKELKLEKNNKVFKDKEIHSKNNKVTEDNNSINNMEIEINSDKNTKTKNSKNSQVEKDEKTKCQNFMENKVNEEKLKDKTKKTINDGNCGEDMINDKNIHSKIGDNILSENIKKIQDKNFKKNEQKKNQVILPKINDNFETEDDKDIKKNNEENNKFYIYLLQMKKKYDSLNIQTPILDYLINEKKGHLDIDYFEYSKQENSIIDHIYDNLELLITKLNENSMDLLDNDVGYLCYYNTDEEKYNESLYSTISLDCLYSKISSNTNFPKDDFRNPDKKIAKNAFKSRALSFEYWIHKEILSEKYEIRERARVIYNFKSCEELIQKNHNKIEDSSFAYEEVDGIIYEDKELKLFQDDDCFIIDKLYNFDTFEDTNKNASISAYCDNSDKELKSINIPKNSLAIIEVKNQFPPNEENAKEIDGPKDFYNMIKNFIKKIKIFKQIYNNDNKKIESIMLILFYNVIQKKIM